MSTENHMVRQVWITRADIRANPTRLYVFGDNMSQSGYGGQAKEMRGEVNVVGIPTKWRPGRKEADYFTDNDANHPVVIAALDHAFGVVQAALRQGITVVLPQAGIGTGLAELSYLLGRQGSIN